MYTYKLKEATWEAATRETAKWETATWTSCTIVTALPHKFSLSSC